LDANDIVLRHFARHAVEMATEGDRGRRDGLPALRVILGNVVIPFPRAIGAGLAPGVRQLKAGHRTGSLDRLDDRFELRSVLIRPNARTAWRNAALRGNACRLHDNNARSAPGESSVVHLMPLVE